MIWREQMEEFERLAPADVEDGEGGFVPAWDPIDVVMCAFSRTMAGESSEGASERPLDRASAVTDKPVLYGDVLRRRSDGETFRCVGGGFAGSEAPSCATFSFCRCELERWEVPDAD